MAENNRLLMRATAIVEGVAGSFLVVLPSFIVSIVLDASLDDPIAGLFARLLGAALITISIACWLSKTRRQSSVMTIALLLYHAICCWLFMYAALVEEMSGPGLWPCVVVHVGLFIWCLVSIRQSGGYSFTQSKMKVIAGRKKRSPEGYPDVGDGDNWKTSAQIVRMKDFVKTRGQKN